MNDYLEVLKSLIKEYNEKKLPELKKAILESAYLPNEAGMKENYQKNLQYLAAEDKKELCTYAQIPFLFLPLDAGYAIIFSKEQDKFLCNEDITVQQRFYQKMVLGDASKEKAKLNRLFRQVKCKKEVRRLYERLSELFSKKLFDKEYLALSHYLVKLLPENEMGEYFLCQYHLAQKNYDEALFWAQRVYNKRKFSESSHLLMAQAHEGVGQYEEAAHYYTLYIAYYLRMGLDINLSFSRQVQKAINEKHGSRKNNILNMAYAPVYRRLFIGKKGLEFSNETYLGKFIFNEKDNFWCGLYNENRRNGVLSKVYRAVLQLNNIDIIRDADFAYDFMKADVKKEIKVMPPAGKTVILPVAGTAKDSMTDVLFKTPSFAQNTFLAENEFSFFRLTEPTEIKSEQDLSFGKPLLLEHSSERKKVVINILADAMSWGQIKADNYKDVPHIKKFFEKGIIFDNQYTVSEYTYPSLATIETGLYPQHTQIIYGDFYSSLPKDVYSISEQMKKLGYYCVNIMGDPESIYDGVGRGYDRIVALDTATGIERLLKHLKAYQEVDNFVFCHFTDTHPFSKADYLVGMQEQVALNLKDHLSGIEDVKSVFLGKNPLNMTDYKLKLKHFDTLMQKLFDYLEKNYAEDEYVISLYSDHGTSVCIDSPYLLNEHQINSSLMMRGCGIPKKGIVKELTSTADIYPALGRIIGFPLPYDYIDGKLPRVLGGAGRDYIISNSIYPGQTYKICVHTDDYVFYLESKELTSPDGIVDLNEFTYHIYERGNIGQEIYNDILRDYFLDIIDTYTKSFRKPC